MSAKTLSCGSDGNWYPNKCFLYKANCFRSPDEDTPPITMIKKNTTNVCGPQPTAGNDTLIASVQNCSLSMHVDS